MSYALMVDSADDSRALYDRVTSAVGKPYAWARYLGNGRVGATPITADEAKFLFGNGVKIPIIYNNVLDADLVNGYQGGLASGKQALDLAEAVGVQRGSVLICDIEQGKSVVGWWFAGWTYAVLAAGFVPAVYCSFADYPRYKSIGANTMPEVSQLTWWIAEWYAKTTQYNSGFLPQWNFPNAADKDVFAWQFAGNTMEGAVDLSMISTDAKLWSVAGDYAAGPWDTAVGIGMFDGSDPQGPVTREMFAYLLVARRTQILKLLGLSS